MNALKKDSSQDLGFTFGIGPANMPVSFDLGLSLSWGQGTLKNFTQYAAKVVKRRALASHFCFVESWSLSP